MCESRRALQRGAWAVTNDREIPDECHRPFSGHGVEKRRRPDGGEPDGEGPRYIPLVTTEPEAQTLADRMSAAWIAFARSGNPEWAAPTAKDRATTVFDASSGVAGDYRR